MVRYSTYTEDLVQALESASPASQETPSTFIDSIHPNDKPEKSKEPRKGIQLPTNCIVLPWPTYIEPRAKRRRLGTQPRERQQQDQHAEIRQKDCRRKVVSHSLDSHLNPSTSVDLEPSANSRANRTKALVSVY